jgi:hypothetical protein
MRTRKLDAASFTNAIPEHLESAKRFAAFHVIRDPRDIVVSGYYSHLYSHPAERFPRLKKHRENLKNASQDDGLSMEMEFERRTLIALDRWNYNNQNVLELRFEDFVKAPPNTLRTITAFLHLACENESEWRKHFNRKRKLLHWSIEPGPIIPAISNGRINQIVNENGFHAMSGGRKPGTESKANHYRKGVVGDWKNHFNDRLQAHFEELYPGLVERLGYSWDKRSCT